VLVVVVGRGARKLVEKIQGTSVSFSVRLCDALRIWWRMKVQVRQPARKLECKVVMVSEICLQGHAALSQVLVCNLMT
jgi:hypothetical protein